MNKITTHLWGGMLMLAISLALPDARGQDEEALSRGVVILADTISAVRPGARAESIAAYIDRLKTLENLAHTFPGVKSAYAIQAGREVRVVVDPESISDLEAKNLSREMRQRIEDELEYPSTIRVTIIREQRFTDTAR